MNEEEYTTVRIPKELSDEIDNLIGKYGFRSRSEVVKEAIRRLLEHYSVHSAVPVRPLEKHHAKPRK